MMVMMVMLATYVAVMALIVMMMLMVFLVCTLQAARHALQKGLIKLASDLSAPTRGAIFSRRIQCESSPQEMVSTMCRV
jgi:hypothetical protein